MEVVFFTERCVIFTAVISATAKQLLQYGDDGDKIGIKKALKEARMLFNIIKGINLAPKTEAYQAFVE